MAAELDFLTKDRACATILAIPLGISLRSRDTSSITFPLAPFTSVEKGVANMKAGSVAILGLLALLIAVACGGAGPSTSSTPDPVELFLSVGENIARATSFHASFTVESAEESGTIEADIIPPDKAHFTLRFQSEDEDTEFEMISVEDQIYVLFPDFQGWFQVPPNGENFGGFGEIAELTGFFTEAFTVASGLSFIAQEAAGDLPVYHLRGTLDREALVLLDPDSIDEFVIMDAWIGVSDSLPLRVRLESQPSGEIVDISFSAFNAAMTIVAPAGAVSFSVVDDLFGGSLSHEMVGSFLSIIPLEGQECLQGQMGQEDYGSLVSGSRPMGLGDILAFEGCLGEIFGDFPDDLDGDEDLAGDLLPYLRDLVAILQQLPPEVEGCLRSAWGDTAFEEIRSGSRIPGFSELTAITSCLEVLDTGGEEDLGGITPGLGDLGLLFEALPSQAEDCLRSAWGDAVFEEIRSGVRVPGISELIALPSCLEAIDLGGDGSGEGLDLPGDESLDIPGDFGITFGQLPQQVLDCLVGKLGLDVVQEFSEGVSQAGIIELAALESCLAASDGGE